jgi:hypothetical protein
MSKSIEGADYCVRFVPLPVGVHGCVSEDCDGFYNVYINVRDSYDRQRKAGAHEIKKHIERGDFSKSDACEAEDL